MHLTVHGLLPGKERKAGIIKIEMAIVGEVDRVLCGLLQEMTYCTSVESFIQSEVNVIKTNYLYLSNSITNIYSKSIYSVQFVHVMM